MPIKLDGRQYRDLSQPLGAIGEERQKRLDSDCYVEGYAAKYEKYILIDDAGDGEPVYEAFDRNAFQGCDMSDIIFQYNHAGKVFARQSNNTLIVEPDDIGLFTAADLSRTPAAKDMFEDIKAGMVTKMSWGFAPGEYHYDPATRTILHTKVRKIYDVSAVSLPANDNTEISARAFSDGLIAEWNRRELERRYKADQLRLRIKLELAREH